MGTAKERAIKAELLQDPEYRAAWDAYRAAVAKDMKAAAGGERCEPSESVVAASQAVFALLDRRPDLVALVEMAEKADH